MADLNRRKLLLGLGGVAAVLAAPAIIRLPGLLMPIRPARNPNAVFYGEDVTYTAIKPDETWTYVVFREGIPMVEFKGRFPSNEIAAGANCIVCFPASKAA